MTIREETIRTETYMENGMQFLWLFMIILTPKVVEMCRTKIDLKQHLYSWRPIYKYEVNEMIWPCSVPYRQPKQGWLTISCSIQNKFESILNNNASVFILWNVDHFGRPQQLSDTIVQKRTGKDMMTSSDGIIFWVLALCSVNSPHKGQWRRDLMFSLICAWTNCWG